MESAPTSSSTSSSTSTAELRRELGFADLTLFAIACIVGPRWIAVAASAGPGSVTLWLAAALAFAAPLGVAVAALVAKYPAAGGLYVWAREDFGPWHGFLCFWVYWFSIALTLPGSAMFAMSVSAFTLGPEYASLADDRAYVVIASLISIWIALGTNLIGMKVGKWTENLGGITAWVLGIVLVFAGVMVWRKQGSATVLNFAADWNWDSLRFFGNLAFGLSGMEVLGMMGGEIRRPKRTIIPAAWIGTAFTTVFYVSCTIALLVLMQPSAISELHGLADGGNVAARLLEMPWITPVITALVVINSVGGWGGLGAAVSRLPYAAGVDHLLPAAFGKLHPRWATPYVSILVFGGVASFLLIVIQLGDSLNAAYQTLLSLMVLVGFLPYFYLFASAWKCGHRIAAALGWAMTLLTVISSAVPSAEVTNVWLFEAKLVAGAALMIGSARLVFTRASAKNAFSS
ncbi:MAG: APC family permease [Acidobacteriota bacterium]